MGERKHTPGPWSYRSQPHDDWGVVRAGRYWICQAKGPRAIGDDDLAAHRRAQTDPWEANARLIAAAPDLLDALEQARNTLKLAGFSVDRANVAIAKATGEIA